MTVHMKVGLLNLDWKGWAARRERQAQALAAADLDVVCLLETAAPDVGDFAAESGFAWCRCSLDPGAGPRRACVAVAGRERVRPLSVHQLSSDDFLAPNSPVDPGLARRYQEKHLAVDVEVQNCNAVRVGAFHAPAAMTLFNGERIRDRKPWFHARMARWVATWQAPYLFAVDANTPKVDHLTWEATRMYWPSTAERPGEELLVGAPGLALHRARDLWREWLSQPAGAADRARVPEDGPLAHSWGPVTGYRYDQIWATEDVGVRHMTYDYQPALSDHALVIATVELPSPRRLRPPT